MTVHPRSHAVVQPHSAGIVRQRQLSDFLYAELLHTLGAYRLSRDKFEELHGEFDANKPTDALLSACRKGAECNNVLQLRLHDTTSPRHPAPHTSMEFAPRRDLINKILDFYELAAVAMRLPKVESKDGSSHKPSPGEVLKGILSVVHDPQRRGRASAGQQESLWRGRIDRMEDRRRNVEKILIEAGGEGAKAQGRRERVEARFQPLLDDYIQAPDSLHLTILEAFSEAHTWMHFAEHLRAQPFGEMLASLPETHARTQRMLRYSLALNTFVFVAARAIPWAFADDPDERDLVIADYEASCDALTPTYCMWIPTQFSMLALHRRAFTYWTMGRHDRAYRDFHKLARLLHRLQTPAEKRAVRAPGTKTFIEGVIGMSELHIGRIYRGQHAHRMAIKYFSRASRHLEGWEKHEDIGEIITNSRWHISLLVNEAKANYELGRIKRALLSYARAWRAFLRLAESESHATANVEAVDSFIAWLKPIADEPELSKLELRHRIAPLVEQFETLRSPKHLELLAAEIVMRTGHLLYVLNLPPAKWDFEDTRAKLPPKSDHDLAHRCILSAAHLDPASTLVAADLLKIEGDLPEQSTPEGDGRDSGRHGRLPPEPIPLADQWPAGSGRFEEAARIIELTLQHWLAIPAVEKGETPTRAEVLVARRLLASFLVHTDSSNVKLAQVYRYLMQEPRAVRRRTDRRLSTLDFVCLRRYSSFFPFLPRPSAFGAPGGGYFVQAREAGAGSEPFGIAIDPGPDFIENLYRCGYALADLHMIVLTHDHADHLASLDALLALMGIRAGLGDERFHRDGRRLAIVGNDSVARRYRFFDLPPPRQREGEAERRDAVSVLSFTDIARITSLDLEQRRKDKKGKLILPMPASFRIEPIRSWGHHDAHGHVSQGFLLSMGEEEDRSSILFTGDTGVPNENDRTGDAGVPSSAATASKPQRRFAKGSKDLLEAVAEADVVVAHLSSVPLRELRQLAGLTDESKEPQVISEFRELWGKLRDQAERKTRDRDLKHGVQQAQFLMRQLQFGFRSRSAKGIPEFATSPFSPLEEIKGQPEQHLYLSGLLKVAKEMRESSRSHPTPPLLLIGELREELGTFRTRISSHINNAIFRAEASEESPHALTADIGLRVRIARPAGGQRASRKADSRAITVLCTTCDLDNDLVPAERFHRPREILEVCVKGEDEGVFYNCLLHDPVRQPDLLWLEAVERYDVFGD